MAYLNHLLSVPSEQLLRCKSWKLLRTHASHEVGCSHLLGYWCEFGPLRDALGHALDGGSVLHPGWRHQLRVPVVHFPPEVRSLKQDVEAAWQLAKDEFGELAEDNWWRLEIEKCLDLLKHAVERHQAVVSILEQSMFVDEPPDSSPSPKKGGFWQSWLAWTTNQG